MTAKDAISSQIEALNGEMTIGESIDRLCIAVERRGPLPVVDDSGRYLGMADASALGAPRGSQLGNLANGTRPMSASSPVSLLLERMAAGETVIPIVDDVSSEMYIGAANRESAMRMAASLFPQLDDYTELTVVCPSGEYSASAIAHAVEDADAHLLNLNVVAGTQPNSPTTVILRVNHSRGDSVARSLARYGYDTVEMAGTPGLLNADMIERVNSLLHYLEV